MPGFEIGGVWIKAALRGGWIFAAKLKRRLFSLE